VTFYRMRRMGHHIERWSGSSGIPIQDSFVSEAFLEPDARDCIGQQLSSPGWIVRVYIPASVCGHSNGGGSLEHGSHGDVEPAENSRVRQALIRLHVAAKTGRIDSAQLRGWTHAGNRT
jgi:hypothetical protein